MADKFYISQAALELIKTHHTDGSGMIATCRAIFSGVYEDEIYNSALLDVFQIICDESDHIVLENLKEFNSIYRSSSKIIEKNCTDEIYKINEFYSGQFEIALRAFREKFVI